MPGGDGRGVPWHPPGSGAPGTLPPVRRHRPAHRLPGDLRPGDRSAARRTPGLVRVAADLPAAGQRQPPAGAVPGQRMEPPAAVLPPAVAEAPQPDLRPNHPGRRAGGARREHGRADRIPRRDPRLPPPAERTHGVAGGPSAARRAAAGGGPLQHPAGRLPLGAGLRPVPVRRSLPELQPTDGGLGARGLLPADAVTGGQPADGGDSAADALHQRHRAHRGTLRLGLVQHRPRLLRGSRHRGDRRPRHRPRALPLQPPGGSPGQCAPGRRTAPATDRRPATGRRLRRALAAPGRTGPPTGPGAGQRRRAAGDGRPGLRPADPDSILPQRAYPPRPVAPTH